MTGDQIPPDETKSLLDLEIDEAILEMVGEKFGEGFRFAEITFCPYEPDESDVALDETISDEVGPIGSRTMVKFFRQRARDAHFKRELELVSLYREENVWVGPAVIKDGQGENVVMSPYLAFYIRELPAEN